MDKLKDYNISFSGLKEGKHLFEYEIGASFFELFENPLIEKGRITSYNVCYTKLLRLGKMEVVALSSDTINSKEPVLTQ